MLVVLSHALAFSVLFVASIFDLETTEVPDSVSVVGIVGGLLLHALASFNSSMSIETLTSLSILLSEPLTWISGLGDPLIWSIGIGLIFTLYGWGLYFLKMWGGADAFIMSALGFAAPYSLSGTGFMHAIDLFLNILLVGFLYTMAFAFYKSWNRIEIWQNTAEQIKSEEKRIGLEIVGAGLISVMGIITDSYSGLLYFGIFLALIFLYRFLQNVQDSLMSYEVPVEELEGGEVLAEDEEFGGKIKGITEEQIGSLEKDTVKIRQGIRFVPVFPIALLVTELGLAGFEWILLMFN